MSKASPYIPAKQPETLLVMVQAPFNRVPNIQSYFDEFLNLIKTAEISYKDTTTVKLREIDTAYFITQGKREEIKKMCESASIQRIVISEQLSPQQARNLEDYLACEIIDRTDLILEIFEKAAISSEGKTQVSIAQFQHKKTRLAGKGIHLSQQAGIRGLRGGPGEKAKERERRHIEQQILKFKRQLESIEQTRVTQRKQRLANKIPHVCLIGYTNAGKSTILNTLTKSNVRAEDKLFATLDTTTRSLFIDGASVGILSDTVGFIQQLPHQLIAAFKSTLSELHYADLLLEVIDLSDANWQAHIEVVQNILNDLGIQKELLYVFNKADRVIDLEALTQAITAYQPHVIVSATSEQGLRPLTTFIVQWSQQKQKTTSHL